MNFTELGISIVASLQVLTLTMLFKHSSRLKRIEDDLYLDPRNPSSYPLTKQVSMLSTSLEAIKQKVEKLEGNIDIIISMLNDMKRRRK